MSLNKIKLFQGLSNVELAQILGKLDKCNFKAGHSLFQQGDVGNCMYIIISGEIDLFSETPDGKSQLLATVKEGVTLGEMAMLTGEPRSATAVAACDVELFVLNAEVFEWFIEQNKTISTYFIRLLSERLTRTNTDLHAVKEERSAWIREELERFPMPIVDCLLFCSLLPEVNNKFIQTKFGIENLVSELSQSPKLLNCLQVGRLEAGWYVFDYHVRRTLTELFIEKHGKVKQISWIKGAAEHYLADHNWELALRIYEEYQAWDTAIDAIVRELNKREVGAKLSAEIYEFMGCCPSHLLFQKFPLLANYIAYCMTEERETGLRLLEAALEERSTYFSQAQTAEIYEWAAECCRGLGLLQKALEFLQMAEMSASLQTEPATNYQLVKQTLVSQKSTRLALKAGSMWKRSRITGVIALAIALLVLILFHFMTPFAGLNRQGMDFIGIGLAAVILWIVNIVPDYIVALFMAMLWTLGGLVKPEIALSGYATSTWLYMLFILAIGAVIAKSGILYRFSLHALKRFPAHYRGQIWGIVAGGILLNPLIPSSSAKVTLGVPIAKTLSESMGFRDQSKGAAGLGLAAMIFYGFTAPFVLTGSYTNVMAYGLVPSSEPISWFQWFLYALPGFLIFVGVMLLFLRILFKNVATGKVISQTLINDQLHILGKFTKQERITTWTVLGCILLMILQPLHEIDNVWVMMFGFATLVISGILDTKTLRSGIDWTFLIFIGIAFSFGEVASQLGIIEALSNFLGTYMQPFMSNPTLFLIAVVLLSFIVTLLVRDDPAVIILMISMLPLAQQVGIHPWILVFVILLSTDPFFFAYQSPTYLTAYYSTEGKSFSHKQGQTVALGYAFIVVLITIVCVPYWEWLGLIH